MGLFDFVKGIGKKNTAPAEPQPAPATPVEPSAQEIANKLLCTRQISQNPYPIRLLLS